MVRFLLTINQLIYEVDKSKPFLNDMCLRVGFPIGCTKIVKSLRKYFLVSSKNCAKFLFNFAKMRKSFFYTNYKEILGFCVFRCLNFDKQFQEMN